MKEIEITASRRKFVCTSSDVLISNGTICWLDTQKYFKEWHSINPIVSKTELNRLKKLGVLSETDYNGLRKYRFCFSD